ncbi:hypothetical protein [Desulforhabdus sp. TSK]|uniref:hypothetical protein n=1 Tax=Desulforhabdus sp. TSK TaxID=2925014 RepID=UPI001FC8D48F|nr:hypothetical protein [Desulforhabdus sp. TSK]GKT10804.1 hypothetical protein DSTSK_41090 [Desulforhabdus sp. TSK]
MNSFLTFLGRVLVAAAIAYLGFSIYNLTEKVVPAMLKTHEKVDQVVQEVEKLKQQLPAIAYQLGKEATKGADEQKMKDLVGKAAERALNPDSQKQNDPSAASAPTPR